ncbi:MAG: peptidoglycan DD-metalloendopeptidase family protein [Alicyclobacillaceae bacterium]|nr:peptidoglycan DD-metalloendopeptidase family protein [Alicyclobacillaceae bacterium]
MNKGQWKAAVAGSLLVAALAAPPSAALAEPVDDIDQQLKQLQQKMEQSRAKRAELQKEIQAIVAERATTLQVLDDLDAKSASAARQLEHLAGQVKSAEEAVRRAQEAVAAAEQRVRVRNEAFKSRVRAMYEGGEIQWLDVLLSATSFSDFVDRLYTMERIARHDREMLRNLRADRDALEEKRKALAAEWARLNGVLDEQQRAKEELDRAREEKRVRLAQLDRDAQLKRKLDQEEAEAEQRFIQQIFQLNRQKSVYRGSGRFLWPVPGYAGISSGFGWRVDPINGKPAGHNGIDIPAPAGTPIVAAEDGTVIVSGQVTGFGNCIIIDHGSNLWTLYGHILDGGLLVAQGQPVRRGQVIAKVGSTGRSTGPHLHFGVYKDGVPVNPMPYLR